MNKNLIKRLHSRLGYWIKYERKRLLALTNNPNLRQDKFIYIDKRDGLNHLDQNITICSRSTLSRIENGQVVYDSSIVNIFLNRFNKKFRINEVDQHLIDSCIQAFYVYLLQNSKISTKYLSVILEDTNFKVKDNFLWNEDYKVLIKIVKWYQSFDILDEVELKDLLQQSVHCSLDGECVSIRDADGIGEKIFSRTPVWLRYDKQTLVQDITSLFTSEKVHLVATA